jgi:hemolysin activation/secretion protein
MRKLFAGIVFVLTVILIFDVFANVQAAQNVDRFKESVSEQERTRQLKDMLERQKEKKEEDSKPLGVEEDKNEEKIVTLKEIRFAKSDILPESFFENIKKEYENTKISVNDIYKIVNAVNNEYLTKGYIASQAYLMEQDVMSGVLVVSLVEGLISEIKLSGNKRTSEKYIKRYLNLDGTNTFNANITNQDIMDFNAANDAKIRIALSPGKVFGTSVVDVIVDEPKMYALSLFCDNSGQKETGKIRYGGYGSLRSLAKYRDILNVGGVFSEGSNSAYISYEIPEPFLNIRIGAGFDYSDTEMVKGVLRNLNVTGNYYDVYLYAKKTFLSRERTSSNAVFSITTKKSESFFSGLKTQDAKTDSLSLSADNTFLFSGGYLFGMLSYAQGMTIIEGENSYEKINFSAESMIGIYKNVSAILKFKGQSSFYEVPSSEQFSVGGINSVRGYPEGMLMSKYGLNANAEINYDVNFFAHKYIDFKRIYAFFDYGIIFPDSRSNLPDDYEKSIYSSGIGLKFGLFKHFDANLACAVALREHNYYETDKVSFLFAINGKI